MLGGGVESLVAALASLSLLFTTFDDDNLIVLTEILADCFNHKLAPIEHFCIMMNLLKSVKSQHIWMEVPCSPKLQQANPAAGLDDEHADAAVVDGHPEPGPGVPLESSAGTIPDDISVTDQDVH